MALFQLLTKPGNRSDHNKLVKLVKTKATEGLEFLKNSN
jgi:hypothetical protein